MAPPSSCFSDTPENGQRPRDPTRCVFPAVQAPRGIRNPTAMMTTQQTVRTRLGGSGSGRYLFPEVRATWPPGAPAAPAGRLVFVVPVGLPDILESTR